MGHTNTGNHPTNKARYLLYIPYIVVVHVCTLGNYKHGTCLEQRNPPTLHYSTIEIIRTCGFYDNAFGKIYLRPAPFRESVFFPTGASIVAIRSDQLSKATPLYILNTALDTFSSDKTKRVSLHPAIYLPF